MRDVTLTVVFLILALICFVIALLISQHVIDNGNIYSWISGGLIALTLSRFPWRS